MRQLLKILGGGFLVFMVVAIAQEWSYFSDAWFGEPPKPVEVRDEDRQAGVNAVRQTLTLMRHFYASGGDVRFAERMPVSEAILAEIRADTEYLAHNQRRQEPQLMNLEAVSVERAGEGRLEVRTRELWTVRFFWAEGEGAAEAPRIQVVYGRYLMDLGPQGWRVEAWSFFEPADEGAAEKPAEQTAEGAAE